MSFSVYPIYIYISASFSCKVQAIPIPMRNNKKIEYPSFSNQKDKEKAALWPKEYTHTPKFTKCNIQEKPFLLFPF